MSDEKQPSDTDQPPPTINRANSPFPIPPHKVLIGGALNQFKCAVLAEIELLEVQWIVPPSPTADGF